MPAARTLALQPFFLAPVPATIRVMHREVAVVIPTRNRHRFLAEAVASIRRQKLQGWELIVIDDASDDGSAEAAEELLRGDDRIRFVRLAERSERSTARNTGLDAVTAPYVLFLDDDDRLRPTALANLVAALRRHEDASVAIGARTAFDGRGHARRAPHPRVRVKRALWRELLVGWVTEWVAVPGQCLLRTAAVREAGGWNASLVGPEDQELLLRLTADRPAVLLPEAVLEYRLHGEQWRPPDVAEQENAFRRDIARRLSARGRQDAEAFVRAGELLRAADRLYDDWQYGAALRSLAGAVKTAPGILISPILSPAVVHVCVKSVAGAAAGRRGARLIRGVRERTRQRLHSSPEANVQILDETSSVPGRSSGYVAAVQSDDGSS